MSTETRKTLLPPIVIVAAMTFGAGVFFHAQHALDLFITITLIVAFMLFSSGFTWLLVTDDRRTRTRLVSIAAQLAPHGLDINVCRGGTYAVVSQGALFEEIVSEELDLDELEAFTAGLRHGVLLARAGHDDGAMEARIARQEAQYSEDRAHIGIDGSYLWRIPGLED